MLNRVLYCKADFRGFIWLQARACVRMQEREIEVDKQRGGLFTQVLH